MNVVLDNAEALLSVRLASVYLTAEHCGGADRLNRRKATIAAAAATDPYSTSMIQSGTNHGCPSVRRRQT
jgi:hypothetical protein